MIKGINHNAIRVTDMEKSLHFYCDIAGLEKAFETHDDNNNPWIVYLKVSEGQFLELFYDGVKILENQYAPDLIGYHHFCFETDNIAELAIRFHANGLMNNDQPSHGKDLNYSCWIHDPDGNAVEFVQIQPDSLHAKSSRT
jgi:catechol 2,3-dioxygenase-like lactoylglutathione lyase family enzyme